jgi:P4 family phage/plasmid primase-like protien
LVVVGEAAASKLLASNGGRRKRDDHAQVHVFLQLLKDKRCRMTKQSFIESLMKNARSHYWHTQLMDDKRNLLGFEDGVLDLDTMEFREGQPSDYLSFSTGWNYNDPRDDHMLTQLRRFLSSVWENEAIESYVVKSLATCLHGGKNRMFFLASGVGGNGKSKLIEAMVRAMGDYATTMNAVYFTTKDAGTGASPHVMDLHGRRLVAFEEPDSSGQLQVDKIKLLTGNNYARSRGLYQSMQTISLQAHLWMSCNHQPSLKMDGGVERRTVFLDFPMQFKPPEELDTSKPNHRPADFDLVKDMESEGMARTLLWYLLQQIKEGVPDSLPLPSELKDHSRNQRDLQDPTAVFVSEMLEKDAEASTRSIDIYNVYLSWSRNNPQWGVDNSRFPLSQTALSMELQRLLGGKPLRRKYGMMWSGYKVKVIDGESLFEEV